MATDADGREGRELFFGIVAPLGVQSGAVENALRTALREAKYKLVPTIKISKWLEKNSALLLPQVKITPDVSAMARKKLLMDAGDALRVAWNTNDLRNGGDAGAFVAMSEIESWRSKLLGEVETRKPTLALPRHAYLIDSLKHPDELDRLRRTYGPAFISIGAYAPREDRREALESGLQPDESPLLVDELMKRDEKDVRLGQRVGEAFFGADFIVDVTRDPKELKTTLLRLVRLIFGDLHVTPEPEEYGMFLARAAQVRTGSLARQIGSAVLRDDGTVASLGTNEVAKAITGGQYWAADEHLGGLDRVYENPGTGDVRDTSDWWRDKMLDDVIETLNRNGYLSKTLSDMNRNGRFEMLVRDEKTQILAKSVIYQDIDYVRAVHAEAAAIIDAGRHGTSLLGTTMYATTFPCHECARHIVAAGIKEVVYLEPYPKSGVATMFRDSISIDPVDSERSVRLNERTKVIFRTFVGVAHSRYLEFFSVGNRERKLPGGTPQRITLSTANPVLPYYTPPVDVLLSTQFRNAELFLSFHLSNGQEHDHERQASNSERVASTNPGSHGKRAGLDVRGRKKASGTIKRTTHKALGGRKKKR